MLRLKHGDCLEVLKSAPDNYADSLVTDPPAGISFMGKDWDGDKGGRDAWVKWMTDVMRECLRVLKPGAHGLVWALPRTAHWTATALEDAGFEVRDCVTHLFGTGFPKSLDISKAIDEAAGAEREVIAVKPRQGFSPTNTGCYQLNSNEALQEKTDAVVTAPATDAAKQWQGWGTALKPACEFWWLVRKPLSEKTVAANVLRWGTGGLNIDGSRIGTETISTHGSGDKLARMKTGESAGVGEYREHVGRFPANLVLDEEAAAALDEQSGTSKSPNKPVKQGGHHRHDTGLSGDSRNGLGAGYGDTGGASRFFYVAKASKRDRGEGNTHPTVKSTELMRYLIKLVTPPAGRVLDPFMGSGTTGVAAKADGHGFVGIEANEEYFAIAQKRLDSAS